MTRNQIYYWEYKRQQAADAETKRTNQAKEQLTAQTLAETIRSNQAKEAEQQRTNIANEYIKRSQNYETARSNRVKESNDLLSITNAYLLGSRQASAAETQARAAAQNALTNAVSARASANVNAARAAEEVRANKAKELETQRHNLVAETTARKEVNVKEKQTAAGVFTSILGTLGHVLGLKLAK